MLTIRKGTTWHHKSSAGFKSIIEMQIKQKDSISKPCMPRHICLLGQQNNCSGKTNFFLTIKSSPRCDSTSIRRLHCCSGLKGAIGATTHIVNSGEEPVLVADPCHRQPNVLFQDLQLASCYKTPAALRRQTFDWTSALSPHTSPCSCTAQRESGGICELIYEQFLSAFCVIPLYCMDQTKHEYGR